ncbi:NAD(P)-binding domain-containing protein [Blastococcus sp. SYSU D00695]
MVCTAASSVVAWGWSGPSADLAERHRSHLTPAPGHGQRRACQVIGGRRQVRSTRARDGAGGAQPGSPGTTGLVPPPAGARRSTPTSADQRRDGRGPGLGLGGGAVSDTRVAVLGCGLMGSAVIRALAAAGHDLVVWNRSPEKAQALVGERVRAAATSTEAVESADVVVSVLTGDDAVRAALQDASLQGRTLVNLTSLNPELIPGIAEWVTGRGGRYLDGVLMAYPEQIGGSDTVVYYAGPADAHREVEPLLLAIGGASYHLSEDVRAAAVMDVSSVGMFVIPALTAYAESVAYALANGIPVELLREGSDAGLLGSLAVQMSGVLEALASGDHRTDQASAATYGAAAHEFLDAVRASGHRGRLLEGAVQALDEACEAGRGDLGISAVAVAGN